MASLSAFVICFLVHIAVAKMVKARKTFKKLDWLTKKTSFLKAILLKGGITVCSCSQKDIYSRADITNGVRQKNGWSAFATLMGIPCYSYSASPRTNNLYLGHYKL